LFLFCFCFVLFCFELRYPSPFSPYLP
jgi:hypothetical protein